MFARVHYYRVQIQITGIDSIGDKHICNDLQHNILSTQGCVQGDEEHPGGTGMQHTCNTLYTQTKPEAWTIAAMGCPTHLQLT
jgi:hypothetical protein